MSIRNTIILNGQTSADIAGLIVQELPPITKPAQRTEIETIDGRDGDIVTPLGFAAYDKEFTIGLYGDYDINAVIAFFNSEGTVVFSNEPDKYYNYQITEQIDFERLVRYRTSKVKMHCQPFKYSATEGTATLEPPAQNLLSIPDFTRTTNGVTLTVSDGTISVNGTPSAATEFYVPTGGLNLSAGSYTLSAQANGTRVAAASIRLIGSVPSNADSFGGNYIGLQNGQLVFMSDTLSAAKTFNYLWFYITAGGAISFTMTATVENEAEKVTSDEGNFLTLDQTDEVPFSKLYLKGDIFQQTHSGKNLLPMKNTTRTISGVTFTPREDGSIVLSGTATSQINYPINTNSTSIVRDISLGAGTYTLSWGSTTVSSGMFVQVYYSVDGSAGLYSTGTFTVSGTEAILGAYIRVTNGTNTNGVIIYPMLEAGSTATDYEKFAGGQGPTPNPAWPEDIQVVSGQQTVKVTGKNLMPTMTGTATQSDVTATATDGVLTVSASNYIWTPCTFAVIGGLQAEEPDFQGIIADSTNSILLHPGTYRISGKYSGGGCDFVFRATDEGARLDAGLEIPISSFVVDGGHRIYSTFTIDHTRRLWFGIHVSSGNFPNLFLRDLQLEIGSTTSDYEEYQEQSYDISLGKNLFSSTIEQGTILSTNGQPSTASNRVRSADFMPVAENTTYTISATSNVSGVEPTVIMFYYDSDKAYITRSGNFAGAPLAVTTPAGTSFCKITFALYPGNPNLTPADISNSQFEEGSTATSYTPYTSPILKLGGIGDYRDVIFENTTRSEYYDSTLTEGAWYKKAVIKKIVLDGSEDFSALASETSTFVTNISDVIQVPGSSPDPVPLLRSDYFIATSYNGLSSVPYGISYKHYTGGPEWLCIRNTDYTSVADFLTWLSSHPTTVYYVLVNPTYTQITEAPLIDQLNAIKNNAHAYKGRTHVISMAADTTALPHIVAAEVLMASDGTITNSGNIYSKPRLTIFGSGDIGISLNGIQYFQIALGDTGHITIDTAAMEAYKDSPGNLQNRLVTGDYDNFALAPGDNQITFSGIVSKCFVENYSRWL